MSGMILAIQGALGQGVLWGIMGLGVYLTFRILDIADLSVDGTFALGGCTCAALMVRAGMDPYTSVILSSLAGMAAGFLTGILYTKCGIPAILAGILTQLGLYSINLRIMDKSNTPFLKVGTAFKQLAAGTGLSQNWCSLLIGGFVAALLIAALYWFFGTEMGSAIRATGNNENMARSQGMNTNHYKILGLALSNGMVSLSGALVSQHQGYADVKQGMGAIVTGLASIIIGEVVLGRRVNFAVKLAAVVAGSCIYRMIVAVVLQMGLSTDDLKLLTAALVALALSVPVLLEKRRLAKRYCEAGEEEKHA